MTSPPGDPTGSPSRAWRSPVLHVTAVACALWAVLLGSLTVGRYDGDPRAFLCLGARFDHPPALAGAPRTSPWGYDGQFYGILASDPLMLDSATVRTLDTPAYRGRRLLLPLAAWASVLGHARAAPYAYLAWCWLLGLTGVGLLARWLDRVGRSPWLALLYAASGGLVVSFIRGTPDAAATALVLAGLWAARCDRPAATVAAFTAAALTRETTLLAPFARAFTDARDGRWRRAALIAVVPAAAVAAWVVSLGLRFGFGSGGGSRNFTAPLAGAWERASLLVAGRLNLVETLGLLAVLATMAAAAVLVARGEREPAVLALAAFSALAAVLGPAVWTEVYASLRVLGVLPALGLACLPGPGFRGRRPLLLAGPVLAAAAGLLLVRVELVPMVPALGNLKGLAAGLLGSLVSLLR